MCSQFPNERSCWSDEETSKKSSQRFRLKSFVLTVLKFYKYIYNFIYITLDIWKLLEVWNWQSSCNEGYYVCTAYILHTHKRATRERKEDGKNNIKRTNNVCKTKVGKNSNKAKDS